MAWREQNVEHIKEIWRSMTKVKIWKTAIPLPIDDKPDIIRYIVKYKKHWWSRWKYVKEHGVQKLYTKEEIEKLIPKYTGA